MKRDFNKILNIMRKFIYTFVILAFVSSVTAQWSEQTSGVTTILSSISAVDDNVVWVCGAGGKVLRTTNGGTNWVSVNSPNSAISFSNILGIDANTALVTGSNTTAYVYKTLNGGANWSLVFSQTGGVINAISFMSLANIDAMFMAGNPVGGRWSLWTSTNAGITWDSTGWYLPQSGTETGYKNSLFFWRGPYYTAKIWFGTNNARIYNFKYGQGWSAQSTGTQIDILALSLADTITGHAGSSSAGLYTTNGGQNWGVNPVMIGSGSINGIAFSQEGSYYLRGSSVYFSATGYNYTAYTQTGTYTHISKPIYRNNIWAIRDNGGISKFTSTIGINLISSQVPSSFSLSQNYPNPFNPLTKIRFDVPRSENVLIKVYDMLGREIETLVNQQLQPGTYEVEWDAAEYPSGVYFYKISTENYTETRKMILIK